jgi:hypothetical protein
MSQRREPGELEYYALMLQTGNNYILKADGRWQEVIMVRTAEAGGDVVQSQRRAQQQSQVT